jgi:hypothetical protein
VVRQKYSAFSISEPLLRASSLLNASFENRSSSLNQNKCFDQSSRSAKDTNESKVSNETNTSNANTSNKNTNINTSNKNTNINTSNINTSNINTSNINTSNTPNTEHFLSTTKSLSSLNIPNFSSISKESSTATEESENSEESEDSEKSEESEVTEANEANEDDSDDMGGYAEDVEEYDADSFSDEDPLSDVQDAPQIRSCPFEMNSEHIRLHLNIPRLIARICKLCVLRLTPSAIRVCCIELICVDFT